MPKRKRPTKSKGRRAKPAATIPTSTTISVYVDGVQKARVLAALELLRIRAGAPVTLSAWILSMVMKAVEEEERLAAAG